MDSIERDPSGALSDGGTWSAVTASTDDRSSRKQDEYALQRLAAIVESSRDAIIAKTLDGVILSWNSAAERIYGYTAEEVVGRSISLLLPPDRSDELASILEKISRGEALDHYETVRVRKDGTRIDVSVTISPIRDENGAIVGASTIARDVTERKGAERKLRHLLVESAPDPMVVVGSDGRIALLNSQAERLFRYEHEELLGTPVEMLVSERFREGYRAHRGRYFADPLVRPMGAELDLYGVRKDGTEFPVEISLSPIETEEGVMISAAIRDVTERRRAQAELQRALAWEREAAARLRELDRLKDEFLTTVSHELRTPLTSIAAFSEVLLLTERELDDATRAEVTERISNNASQMGAMIEQLLDYSRLQADKVTLTPAPLPVRDAVMSSVEAAAVLLGSRKLAIDIPVELEAFADERGFQRILVNLLTNAAKFSPDGSVIRLTGGRADNHAVLSVQDEGIGISPEDQTRIFERFYQSTTVSGRLGTGVGLSIVKRYVELHGGRVWVESEPGVGSTFSFTLPVP